MATRARVNSALRAQHMPPHLRHLEGKFKNSRGQNLSYLALFPPANAPLRAVVLYLHGIGDHSRRYFYSTSSCAMPASECLPTTFPLFVDDTNEFIKMAKTELYPKLSLSTDNEPKMILAGMSYGTLVSLHTILSGKHDFSGVVLVAPALLVEMTAVLRDYLDDFKADPLTVSEPVTARMGAETLKAMRALEADKRVEDKDKAGDEDKEFKVFDGYFHALFETRSAQIAEEPKVEVADVTPVVENVETETTVVGEVKVETTASATEETKVEVTTAQEHKSETVNSDLPEKEEPAAVGSSDKSLRRMRLKSKLTKRNEDEGSAS
ncbi:Alpha/Beta hydrolase fold [Phytophthora cactorum]|nr:Alpha/Beta hydrolase fold [Phytophthora cactorum]